LLDFNREKEIPYREKPAVPNIAIPSYTYDLFSITGEGTGGMFRAYRGDIGFVYDHAIRTKDETARFSGDIGVGDLGHSGVDLNLNRAYTQNGPWLAQNTIQKAIDFRQSNGLFEAAYFRNPGEKSINSKQFYEAIGGDDVVTVNLSQDGNNNPVINASPYLIRYRNKKPVDAKLLLTPANAVKPSRDKRSQVISYLTASEASVVGLSKYIDNYALNQFNIKNCYTEPVTDPFEKGTGLQGYYYDQKNFKGHVYLKKDPILNYGKNQIQSSQNKPVPGFPNENFSVRWVGRLKAPVSGTYLFKTYSDDGMAVYLNDTTVVLDWRGHGPSGSWQLQNRPATKVHIKDTVNLVAGQYYDLRVEYWQGGQNTFAQLYWQRPGKTNDEIVPTQYLFLPDTIDAYKTSNGLVTKEERVNAFRRANHISEIDVLNTDGRRYVYGIPVYNFRQKEVTFAVNSNRGNRQEGVAGFTNGVDNTTSNPNGKDRYFNKEETPAYAHSFLLTGILSPDYTDLTGDGISDDDPGEAIKFNYSKVRDYKTPYQWRAPYVTDSVNYNEALRTDNSDDKGSYVYGEKELWYLNSVESKNMIATFTVEDRLDGLGMTEAGKKIAGGPKLLRKIDLYTKADFYKRGTAAIPIKTVHFEYSYDLCRGINRPANDSGKLTLRKIWFTYNGNDKGKLNPYVFNYHVNNPRYAIKSYDRWGNYKDPRQNPGSTDADVLTNAEYPYALQDSTQAGYNAAAWTLNRIGLPSGGSINVEYESDDYAYVQNKRAMNLFNVLAFSSTPELPAAGGNTLYNNGDNLYVFVQVPAAVGSRVEVYQKYLEGVTKLYFKLFVQMPTDRFGGGYEYVPCYADLENYDIVSSNVIRLKLKGISMKGDEAGNYSPLAKAAIQFLRLNLPSKAYPGSDIGDDVDLGDAVQMVLSMANHIVEAFKSFDAIARSKNWAQLVDLNRTYVRLDNPAYHKYGGGLRVKKILIADNWDAMTGQRPAVYGQEYTYTTTKNINGVPVTISSGVASYEPSIGGEENPFHQPIEYLEKIAPLAPVSLGYVEAPLGESFFPSAGVGYSQVRVRTIHAKNIKSANGYEETRFYTAYDFPTLVDYTVLEENKKKYHPKLQSFLRIDAKYYLGLSQGFKIELNDMHGKVKSQATYPETDPVNPISYTENFYKTDNGSAEFKHLANTVSAIDPSGLIDTAAIIGKDVELMMDMREQQSVTNGNNFNVNGDLFSVPFIPGIFLLPSFIGLAQREENLYHSVAAAKVIQRYGILDSVVHVEKGSRVTTRNLLYDSETGNVLLTQTGNEFNDPVYTFTYPSFWAYDGMGQAYQNIDAVLNHVFMKNGKIIRGAGMPDSVFFSPGDEILVASRLSVGKGADACNDMFATFPVYTKLWAVDVNMLKGGPKSFYFIDQDGKPFTGNDLTMKVIRSGRRNINSTVGAVSTLQNPVVKDAVSGQYRLVLNTDSKVLNASAAEYTQFWQVAEKRKLGHIKNCVEVPFQDCTSQGSGSCTFNCLKSLFDYLISSQNLFTSVYDQVLIDTLISNAQQANYPVPSTSCPVLANNLGKTFYATTFDTVSNIYQARIGDCIVSLNTVDGRNVPFYRLQSKAQQDVSGRVAYYRPDPFDTVTQRVGLIQSMEQSPMADTTVTKLRAAAIPGKSNIASYFRFDSVPVPGGPANLLNATMHLFSVPDGFQQPYYPYSSSVSDGITFPQIEMLVPGVPWNYTTPEAELHGWLDMPQSMLNAANPFLDYTKDVTAVLRNQYFSWPNGNNGFCLIAPSLSCVAPAYQVAQYVAFCSQRYPDSTRWPYMDVTYQVPRSAEEMTATVATLGLASCTRCDSVGATICYNPITDTIVNPYLYGVLGNFRLNKSYVYYGSRAESDPAQATNIRVNGTFSDFNTFWQLGSNGMQPRYDTTRWVWNTQMTLFNGKGYELENKDPLGRFNAGLYGYNESLPTAVVQNARYNESAFEGFEDYGYDLGSCDTGCVTGRHFDFSSVKDKITSEQSHTGKYSILVNPGDVVGLSALVIAPGTTPDLGLNITTGYDNCIGGQGLKGIKATPDIMLPVFSPIAGKKVVVSAWVKEKTDCQCRKYKQNQLAVSCKVNGTTQSNLLYPSGNIIEGWQRYEGVVNVPAGTTNFSLNLMATGSTAVYFDDIRIHPFNANMKSFVYDPVNLRLMAELDENNYATFYEYDDDGTLVRVKKETERGIKTIKETRSALLKQ
jgi:hypothetical protein